MYSFPVLWIRKGDLKTLELRTEIMQRLMERELKQAKETVIFLYLLCTLIKMNYCE